MPSDETDQILNENDAARDTSLRARAARLHKEVFHIREAMEKDPNLAHLETLGQVMDLLFELKGR